MGRFRIAERHPDGPPAPGRLIAELAGRHHGIVDGRELRALGLDRSAIARRVQAGGLHPVHRNVYAVGHSSLSQSGRRLAAVRACGPGAALSHRAAADLWGLRPSSGRIEVTAQRRRERVRGVTVHRSRMLASEDVTVLDWIPVTTVARTLLDLAGVVPQDHLVRALDRAERLQLSDRRALDAVLARARGKRGASALRRALEAWRPRYTRSELEDRFEALVKQAGLSQPQLNLLIDGEQRTHEVDAFWPIQRLVVQLDGFAYHRTRRDRERDAESDTDLELAGLRVMRLTWNDVTVREARTARRLAGRLTLPAV